VSENSDEYLNSERGNYRHVMSFVMYVFTVLGPFGQIPFRIQFGAMNALGIR
jgi:hypothetical protein